MILLLTDTSLGLPQYAITHADYDLAVWGDILLRHSYAILYARNGLFLSAPVFKSRQKPRPNPAGNYISAMIFQSSLYPAKILPSP